MSPSARGFPHHPCVLVIVLEILFTGCTTKSSGDSPPIPKMKPPCGDGLTATDEGCDDGNTIGGDGCDPLCRVEPGFSCIGDTSVCSAVCGDGLVRGGEACDEGLASEGCTLACVVRAGFACAGEGAGSCHETCGDGRVVGREACDDGNGTSGDGCNAGCARENGYRCDKAQPTGCAAICGDGLIVGDESCDDGNLRAGDGCDPSCVLRLAWRPIPNSEPPEPRFEAATTWTDHELFIWGGEGTLQGRPFVIASGHLYDPRARAWRAVNPAGAPAPRHDAVAVFTGTEVLVWGGRGTEVFQSGGRYNPRSNTWRPMSLVGAPSPRFSARAVWTGRELIVFGGLSNAALESASTGGAYDPNTDSWRAISNRDAPSARYEHTAIWTGREMIIFGGESNGSEPLGDGGAYDPNTDTWRPLALAQAPSPRSSHTAIWTGTEMLVFGGEAHFRFLADGAGYDPVLDAWHPIAPRPAEDAARLMSAVWTGSEVLMFGGSPNNRRPAKYIPAIDAWVDLTTEGAPTGGAQGSVAVTPEALLVFGGWEYDPQGGIHTIDGGGRFDLREERWSTLPSGPTFEARQGHSAERWGSELIVWGGSSPLDTTLATGVGMNVVTGAARSLPIEGAPSRRERHTGIITHDELIIWGGRISSFDRIGLADGASLDLVEERWAQLSTEGSPSGRFGHTAISTGEEMIVFGGAYGRTVLADGGRFDLKTRAWEPLPLDENAPSARYQHACVWTGTEMIVWGGTDSVRYFDTGARFNPALGRWASMSRESAPSARALHSAIWTGNELIVFGGSNATSVLDSGARYDPVTDRWSALPRGDIVTPRASHSATWTGAQMVVIGGFTDTSMNARSDIGIRYDPVLDTWLSLPASNAPHPRAEHSAVWMDASLVIWGGVGANASGSASGLRLSDGALLDL